MFVCLFDLFLQIRSATPADLICLNAFCPCSSCQASCKHNHIIVSLCASCTFSFSLKSFHTFHPLSVKVETSLKMTCEIRSLTGLQCDYMNLFILKIYASLNRTVNHPPRPKRCLRPLLCHNESNMEIRLLLLLLIFEPLTISPPLPAPHLCDVIREARLSFICCLQAVGFSTSFTRQFLQEH